MKPPWPLEGRSEAGEDQALSEGLPWLFLWALGALLFFLFLKIAGMVPSCDQVLWVWPLVQRLWVGVESSCPPWGKMEKWQLLTAGPNVFGDAIFPCHRPGGGHLSVEAMGVTCALSCLEGQRVLHRRGLGQLPGPPWGWRCAWLFPLRASCVGDSEALSPHTAGGLWASRELQGGVLGSQGTGCGVPPVCQTPAE